MKIKQPCVYIMASAYNGTLYVGVTSNLIKRMEQYKTPGNKGFVHKYNCKNLVYYELYNSIVDAIEREKQLKGGSRQQKIDLIESVNQNWMDLCGTLF